MRHINLLNLSRRLEVNLIVIFVKKKQKKTNWDIGTLQSMWSVFTIGGATADSFIT